MTIKKFSGKTEAEAIEKAHNELGSDCVIMNVREIKPKGLFKAFKSSTYEVTAAVADEDRTASALQKTGHKDEQAFRGKIDLAANEQIHFAPVAESRTAEAAASAVKKRTEFEKEKIVQENQALEERLENLQTLIEKKLEKPTDEENINVNWQEEEKCCENMKYLKVIYNTLLENEVREEYINQLFDVLDNIIKSSASLDNMVSSVYQKMVLKLGQAQTVDLTGKKPKVIFFVGPTGVGKTTTIAKIASKLKVDGNKKIELLTADTYRIAAAEQLRTYANILDTPLTIIYTPDELNKALAKAEGCDAVLIDTAGFSHKNEAQKKDMMKLLHSVDEKYAKEFFLVVSATTKYRDLTEIVDAYKGEIEFKLIFTKLDETNCYGNLYNIRLYTGADLSYVTTGQNVPDDIEVMDTQKIVKALLGGK